jgi:hypothetical protein
MKRIIKTLKKRWPEYLLEVLVITASIYGAFLLNSWKENTDKRGEETTILNGLKAEFEVNISEVKRNIELNSSTVQTTATLIELIRTEEPFANQRYFDSLLYVAYMFGTFDAQTGIVDEIISSGKLSIIKDPQLRNRLTSISGMLDNAEEDYTTRGTFYMHEIIPYLSKYIPLVNADEHLDFSSWSETYQTKKRISRSTLKAKYSEIDLLIFENLIYQHKLNNDFVNLNESQMESFFVETLDIINDNLQAK